MSPEEMPGVPAEEPSEESLPEESRGTYRNHPTVLADNLISGAIGGFFIILIAGLTGRDLVVGTAVFAGLTFAVAFVYWLKTEFEFHETEMVRNRNTVSKSVKRIQYNRLASVEVRRTITNHIFGTSTLMFNVNSGVNATVS
ncbi:MAG: hypothetical protein Q4Q58_05240, partial [Thermoplasmata archaeon]|nr:hypothetical protein [Thermoplasmata archaeon]